MSYSDNVYSSEQYKMLKDLSAMMTGVVYTIPFEHAVSAELSTKLSRDHELFFAPSCHNSNNFKYNTTLTAAGIEIVKAGNPRPSLYFEFGGLDNYFTIDKLSSFINQLSAQYVFKDLYNDVSAYWKHYTSGVLNTLYMDIKGNPIDAESVQNAFDSHNKYAEAHTNVSSLQFYYNKIYINDLESKINHDIASTYITLYNYSTYIHNDFLSTFNNHETSYSVHQNINKLKYYYLKTEVEDRLATEITKAINNHNTAEYNLVHKAIRDTITIIQNDLLHLTNRYNNTHADGEVNQVDGHSYLLRKNNPESTGTRFLLDYTKNSDHYFTIEANEYGGFIITPSEKKLHIINKINSSNGYGSIHVGLQNNTTNAYWITLLDNNGNSVFKNISVGTITMSAGRTSTPSQTDISDIIPNTEWVKQYIMNNGGDTPVGTIIWWTGNPNNIPAGWLICDNRYIDETYSALRSLVGERTPNLINRFIQGAYNSRTYQDAGLPNIYRYCWCNC